MKAAVLVREAVPRLRLRWDALRRGPLSARLLPPLGRFAAALLLSSAALGGRPLPLAACFLLSEGRWPTAAAAAAGAAAGSCCGKCAAA